MTQGLYWFRQRALRPVWVGRWLYSWAQVLEVCNGVTNEKEKDGVYERSGRLRSEGPRATGAPLWAKCSSMCLRSEPSGSMVVSWWTWSMSVYSKGLKKLSFVGGSASPFIDKRDGFTSERVRVRMLLGSVAHASGYKIMVGAYNTIGHHCRVPDACGRLRRLLQKWQMSVPANTINA